NFYARGFEVTGYHIDGGAAVNTVTNILLPYQGTPDLSEFDHIELLRGADALFAGGPNPGATVSLVRKRPQAESRVTLDTTIGSWNNARVELDSTGSILDGKLRARLDGVYQRRDYFYDLADMTRGRVFGVLDYDVGRHTVLTVGGSYQHDQA